MRRRGRPVLGAISGLLLGAFVAVDLMMFKVHRLDDLSVFGLPAIGLVLGILLGLLPPFGGGPAAPASAAPATGTAAPPVEAPPEG